MAKSNERDNFKTFGCLAGLLILLNVAGHFIQPYLDTPQFLALMATSGLFVGWFSPNFYKKQ